MTNRDWETTEHGVCVSARIFVKFGESAAARLEDAAEDATGGDLDVALTIILDLAKEMRLLAAGANVLVNAFDASRS